MHQLNNIMCTPLQKPLILLVMFSVLCSSQKIDKIEGINLSENERINLDKQFKLIQKPSMKIIEARFGDIYDCVDFYQQPAFDHPLLKNHSFHPEMRPSFPSNNMTNCKEYAMFKDDGCPKGTIPIRRVSKEEYYNIHSFSEDYAKINIEQKSGTHIAIIRTNSDPSGVKYSGVGGTFNIYNFSIEPPQYSSGQLVIQNGDDRIKVGWTVNPTVYNDNQIHLFQYLDAGNSHCFDTLCPGFVVVEQYFPLGYIFSPSSVRGGPQYHFQLHVYKDAESGHWWLNVCGVNIGFWPKQIFTTMSEAATYIAVGGEAYGTTDHPLPPMGNGYYPVQDMKLSAYSNHIVFVDEYHKKIDHPQTELYVDDQRYGVYDAGDTVFGRLIFYGGPNK